MGLIATLVTLTIVGLGAYRLARSLLRLPGGFPSVFAAFVLAWTWLTLGTLGLGLAGWLTRGPILTWSLGGPIVALLFMRQMPKTGPQSDPLHQIPWGFDVAIAFGLSSWAIVAMVIPSLVLPVKVISDGPIYHLYFAARWWQAGRIFLVATPFGETAAPYFPAVGDMWLTWLLVVGGGDRLARVGQMPFYMIAALVVYALARMSGARPAASALASCWFATVSPLMVFTVEPVVDTIFLAGYLVAFYFAVRYVVSEDGPAALILAGLAAGGACGTKAPGLVFVPPLLLVLAIFALTSPGRPSVRIRNAALVLATPLVLAGFWFARNAWLTGNPLYPLEVTVFGRTIFPGWYARPVMTGSRYYVAVTDWRSGFDILLGVLDPRLVLVWLAAVGGAWRLGRSARPGDRLAWICAQLALINVALYWVFIPYRTQQRFVFHATALAAIPLARLFDRARVFRLMGVALLAVHVLTAQDWPFSTFMKELPWDLSPQIPSRATSPVTFLNAVDAVLNRSAFLDRGTGWLLFAVGGVCMVGGLMLSRAARGSLWGWMRPIVVLGVAGGLLSFVLVNRITDPIYYRFPYFTDYLSGWADLEARVGRTPTRIAYAGTNLPYYLLGRDLENDVRYVNLDGHRNWLLHDYHRAAPSLGLPSTWPDTRPGWDRVRPNYSEWLANLVAERIRFLVVTKADPLEGQHNPFDSQGFPVERAFADAHPDRFRLLYGDGKFRLYAVRPAAKNREPSTDSPASSH